MIRNATTIELNIELPEENVQRYRVDEEEHLSRMDENLILKKICVDMNLRDAVMWDVGEPKQVR